MRLHKSLLLEDLEFECELFKFKAFKGTFSGVELPFGQFDLLWSRRETFGQLTS